MNSRFPQTLTSSRFLLGGVVLFLAVPRLVLAQNAQGGGQAVAQVPAGTSALAAGLGALADKRQDDFRKDFSDAKGLAKSNNIAAAEVALTKSNIFQKDTPDWHFETTQKLLQTAHDLSKEGTGNAASVQALATQSLQHLSDAAAATKDSAAKARAKAQSAFIYDRYMGDPTTAIATYKAALQLAPADQTVKEALDRLEKADANLRAKIRPARK